MPTAPARSASRKPKAKAGGHRWGGISSESVEKATGKGWAQWCRVLDKDKAAAMPHREIAELVAEKHGVKPWWSQMVTVGYEQARGLREKHQKADGFSASASRTYPATMAAAFKAVSDARQRGRWLKETLTVTKATPGKSVRITWGDGTKVAVGFYKAGKRGAKTQVTFQHDKLKNAAAVAKMKKYWAGRLDALGVLLDG